MNKRIDITGVILKTPRLTLRPWKETDLQDFYDYASVEGVGQMAGWMPHRNMEDAYCHRNRPTGPQCPAT